MLFDVKLDLPSLVDTLTRHDNDNGYTKLNLPIQQKRSRVTGPDISTTENIPRYSKTLFQKTMTKLNSLTRTPSL